MSEKVYRVFMSTPLGKKYGTLATNIAGSDLSGHLDILAHSEPFAGTIDSKGNCAISGVFTTLMRRVPYKATGTLSDCSVHLMMQGERRTYELSGNRISEKEETDL